MQWIIRYDGSDTVYNDKEWAKKCLKSARLNHPDAELYECKEVETKLRD